MRALLLIALLACSTFARSEIYQGITAWSSLGEIKKRFPNATIAKLKPVWATSSDGFYLMTGVGFSGSIYLAFHDSRPIFAELVAARVSKAIPLRRLPDGDDKASQLKESDDRIAALRVFADQNDDDALVIEWVRWVPVAPVPIERFISKYGPSNKTAFKDDDMQPYSEWTNKSMVTTLTDDQKRVISVDYGFTALEKATACRSKWGAKYKC